MVQGFFTVFIIVVRDLIQLNLSSSTTVNSWTKTLPIGYLVANTAVDDWISIVINKEITTQGLTILGFMAHYYAGFWFDFQFFAAVKNGTQMNKKKILFIGYMKYIVVDKELNF